MLDLVIQGPDRRRNPLKGAGTVLPHSIRSSTGLARFMALRTNRLITLTGTARSSSRAEKSQSKAKARASLAVRTRMNLVGPTNGGQKKFPSEVKDVNMIYVTHIPRKERKRALQDVYALEPVASKYNTWSACPITFDR